jgi:hypothetical protein
LRARWGEAISLTVNEIASSLTKFILAGEAVLRGSLLAMTEFYE